MKNDSPTILIVKYRALGDSVMGLSSISYLRSIYPNSKIYYGVRAWTAKLYSKVQTDADQIIGIDLVNFWDFIKLAVLIYKLKIGHVHEMHLSGRTKKFFSFAKYFLGFKYTFHNHHLKNGEVLDQGIIKPLIQRDLDGVYTFLTKTRDEKIPNYLDWAPAVKQEKSVIKKKRIILGVVATRQTKMWSLKNYVELARRIKAKDETYEIVALLSRSKDDQVISKNLQSIDRDNLINIENIPLENLFNYFSTSKLYVGNDTGLKHIAIASGIKTYTMFGPEPTSEWHPYNELKHPYFYIDNLECRTRTAHYCGLSTCSSMICMDYITVEDVFEKIRKELI